jgi:dihydrofolate reductase
MAVNMRKLKLQVQMTVDGFVAGPNGEMDWMSFNWGNDIINYVNELTDSSGTILLGRKMTEGFISHWSNVVSKPDDPSYAFGKKMIDIPKVVFSRTLDRSSWINTTVANGKLGDEIDKLKKQPGKDIIIYGGVGFVSSLIGNNLIDEYHIFINPVAIGKGMTIFNLLEAKQNLTLIKSKPFDCGIVVNCYVPNKKTN